MFVKFPIKNQPENGSFLIISGIRSIVTSLQIRILFLNSLPCVFFSNSGEGRNLQEICRNLQDLPIFERIHPTLTHLRRSATAQTIVGFRMYVEKYHINSFTKPA